MSLFRPTSRRSPAPITNWFSRAQRGLFVLGVALLAVYGSALICGVLSSRLSVWEFTAVQEVESGQGTLTSAASTERDDDFKLWSAKRLRAYKAALALKMDRPIGVLTIPRLRLTVPIFGGTDLVASKIVTKAIAATEAVEGESSELTGIVDWTDR